MTNNIENLVQLLRNMNAEIKDLNTQIENKSNRIVAITKHIDELNTSLMSEKQLLDVLNKKRDKVTELQSVAETNFKQINDSVTTLLEILNTGKND
jgi:chromosome segregation ATPase